MKQIFGLIICSLFLLTSCEKEKSPSPPEELLGSWKWLFTYYGFAPGPMNPKTPQNTGSIEEIVFNQDFSWKILINSVSTDSGTFKVGHGSYSPSNVTTYNYDSIQYFKNGLPIKDKIDFFEVHHDTLAFCSIFRGIYGGQSKFYVKN